MQECFRSNFMQMVWMRIVRSEPGNRQGDSSNKGIGGRRNDHSGVVDSDPLPAVYTARAVQDTIARLLNDLHAGKIHPNVAGTMATLLNLQPRAIEATDQEGQIAKLQRQLAETHENSEITEAGVP